MAETLRAGRVGQLYVAAESPYGTPPTLLATHALVAAAFNTTFNAFNRVNSPDKKQSPGVVARHDRASSAGATLEAIIKPSGTLNTLSMVDTILAHVFSAASNITLATTVSASPSPSTTVFSVASATGLVVGQGILVTVVGVKYVRWITNIATLELTVAPALPSAPASGAAVKGVCTYKLASAITTSLCAARYGSTDTVHSKIVKGAVVEQFGLSFARNEEPRMTATMKAKTVTTPAPTKPAGFTIVGTQNPPSGTTGECYIGNAAHKIHKLDVEIQTGVKLRENSFGCSSPEEILMTGRRDVKIKLDTIRGDESVIYDLTEVGTRVAVHMQIGLTEGNIVAIYAPLVDFSVPSESDTEDVPEWSFDGVACESADAANNEIVVCLA